MQFKTVYSNVPKQNRPFTDASSARTPFKANPISHYRYSLGFGGDGVGKTGSRRVSISALDRPGGMGATNETIRCTGTSTNTIPINTQIFSEQMCQTDRLVHKPASTILSTGYYPDTGGYLKARARSFTQNDSTHRVQIYSTDTNGSITSCDANITNSPRNKKYYSNGAVSSGTRIERLKYESSIQPNVKNVSPHFVKMTDSTCCTK